MGWPNWTWTTASSKPPAGSVIPAFTSPTGMVSVWGLRNIPMKLKVTDRNVSESAIAALQLQRALESLDADREKEIADIKERYAVEEKSLKKSLKEMTESLKQYVLTNQDDLFEGENRFVDISGVRLGLRVNPPAVTKNTKLKWEDIAHIMHANSCRFVRITPEVDREGILRERDSLAGTEFVAKLDEGIAIYGLAVTQEETFYIKGAE